MDESDQIALSNALLAGTSFWVVYRLKVLNYATGTFGLIGVYALYWMWIFGKPRFNRTTERVDIEGKLLTYILINATFTSLILSGENVQLYLHYGWKWTSAIIHMAISATLLPFGIRIILVEWHVYFTFLSTHLLLCKICLLGNLISMSYISFTHSNSYGMAAAATYAVSSYVFWHFTWTNRHIFAYAKPEAIISLGMCVYVYYAYKALC